MVMIESDEGYQALDDILQVEGIDMLTVGEMDWSVSLGLFGAEAKRVLAPKIERVLTMAHRSGKILAMGGGNPQQADYYRSLGVRLFFVGVDVNLKRKVLSESLSGLREVLG
jgi:4-hydroxy-2-oxoheptanedioate aldolase